MRVPPVHWWQGAAEDGPVGVDQEPLDGCREGLVETGLHMVGTWGLAISLVQGGLEVLHGVLLDLCPGPIRDPGDMAAEDCLINLGGPPGICHTVPARRREPEKSRRGPP